MDTTASLTLTLDATVRSIGVNKTAPHAFLLGAGASVSSGIPSANVCIWEWKRKIFLTNNPGLENQFRDITLPGVQQKIQRWLDVEGGYPPAGSPDEYGFFVNKCFPILDDRRQYFQELSQSAIPHLGYELLCLLAESDLIKSVWTTNFDGLAARAAAASKVTPIEVGLDTTHRAFRQPRAGELLCVAIHGDYRYDALKNIPAEIQNQDKELRKALIEHLKNVTIIVIGYSGRDESVMSSLTEAYSQHGQGRLFWCGYEDAEPPDGVKQLLVAAQAHGREAYYVPSLGFDDLMRRLSLHCLSGELLKKAQEQCSAAWNKLDTQPPRFTVSATALRGITKSNAFQVSCPSEVLQFEITDLDGPHFWKRLRQQAEGRKLVVAPQRGKVLALGTVDDIKAAFSRRIQGAIERSPIADAELSIVDGVVVSLLTEALLRSLAESRELGTDNRRKLWERKPRTTVIISGVECSVHDAVICSIRRYGGKQYLVIKPTIKAFAVDGTDVPPEAEKELKRSLLTRQYNKEFNDVLDKWRKLLFNETTTTFEFPPNCGSMFKFNVRSIPAFARIFASQAKYPIILPSKFQHLMVFSGIEYHEPKLVFSNADATAVVKDEHPIRGMVQNRPFDFKLTRQGIAPDVRLGIVCPAADSRRVSAYLSRLHLERQPDSKIEYLLPYSGFSKAFGLPLVIPEPGSNAWVGDSEPDGTLDVKEGAVALARSIIESIKSVHASASPNVVIIYIPDRWKQWEHYDYDGEWFDLHDFVKAYCVQEGITTQFLREATLTKPYQCEVIWWIALSLYVKAMRTPWILESMDTDTAFVGLGFSLRSNSPKGEQVVLGCSHLYNSEGMGLRYKLRKIENPIIRQGNPFLSFGDARRVGESVRQLFFESMMAVPKRVVIHKRTPFLQSERQGLIEGLAGVDAIDMLEITVDPMLRHVASRLLPNGSFQGDGFPVRRGTAVILDSQRALVWVHGTADAINPKQHYYQGKSRIPAPLVVTRHHGTSSLASVASEILGLSKMNWNTYDLYTKLPATIYSSNAIAGIGALLERFSPASYDYRLFI